MKRFGFFERQRQVKAQRQSLEQLKSLSEADLADMGIKRYQLDQILRG
ncbi:MAG: DUF1127 domain-containing protein [Alphaproteobacteria bacterium]|nr:DUF1127 domain-containing protein [Alphaproteobacteria bacterium]